MSINFYSAHLFFGFPLSSEVGAQLASDTSFQSAEAKAGVLLLHEELGESKTSYYLHLTELYYYISFSYRRFHLLSEDFYERRPVFLGGLDKAIEAQCKSSIGDAVTFPPSYMYRRLSFQSYMFWLRSGEEVFVMFFYGFVPQTAFEMKQVKIFRDFLAQYFPELFIEPEDSDFLEMREPVELRDLLDSDRYENGFKADFNAYLAAQTDSAIQFDWYWYDGFVHEGREEPLCYFYLPDTFHQVGTSFHPPRTRVSFHLNPPYTTTQPLKDICDAHGLDWQPPAFHLILAYEPSPPSF